MIHPDLLENLRCPETKQKLRLAEPDLIASLNARIEKRDLRNRAGQPLSEKIDGGLVREDEAFLYPIRHKLPIMLIDEAIALEPQESGLGSGSSGSGG
jgi:uncharacterized protein YbaR (Trm112 family)